MKKSITLGTIFLLLFSFALIFGCDNSDSSDPAAKSDSGSSDSTAPTAAVLPVDTSTLKNKGTDAQIVITFSETINTGTLTIGGDFAGDAYDTAWSADGGSTNDTLTISPQTSWTIGIGRSITIDCDDTAGNSLITITNTYKVEKLIIYVDGAVGLDTNAGTFDDPKETIQGGIDAASANIDVWVAAGTYNSGGANAPVVTLKEAVSVYGGYNATFSARDTESIIIGNGLHDRTVYGSTGITNAAIIDGFTINGGSTSTSYTIYNDSGSSPTIQNNIINGGTGTTNNYGIYNTGSSAPLIQNNTAINGGEGNYSYAIYNTSSSSPIIQNNTSINGGTGAINSYAINNITSSPTIQSNDSINGGSGNYSYAIYNTSSSPDILSNTNINGGTGTSTCYAIYNYNSSSPTIDDNTLINGGGGDYSYAVFNNWTSSPTISNNTINGGVGADATLGISSDNNSDGTISGNTINGGGVSTTFYTYGIKLDADCNPDITGNTGINGGGSLNNTNYSYGIYTTSGSTVTPQIEDNTINGGNGLDSIGIYTAGSSKPNIVDNTINGGEGGDSSDYNSYGIYSINFPNSVEGNLIHGGAGSYSYGFYHNGSGTPRTVERNTIYGGDPVTDSYAVYILDSSLSSSKPHIHNNVLHGGTGDNTYGIYTRSGDTKIRNNTIYSGNADASTGTSYGIFMYENGAQPSTIAIDNNIIFTDIGSTRYTIYENNSDCDPSSLRNNDLYDFNSQEQGTFYFYYDDVGSGNLSSIASLNAYTSTTQNVDYPASGNINVKPTFVLIDVSGDLLDISVNNWDLTSPTLSGIYEGGLNGIHTDESWGSSYSTDRDGDDRTPGDNTSTVDWSMGAYEYNPPE